MKHILRIGLPILGMLTVAVTAYAATSWTTTAVDGSINAAYTSIALDSSSGLARIAFYDAAGGDLEFVECTNAACSTKNITTVDSTGDIGFRPSMRLGSDGFARISYSDATNRDLMFAQCLNASCSDTATTTVDWTGSVGDESSLVLDENNLAYISYYDATNGDLLYAQCLTEDCTDVATTTVDTTGSVGDFPSIALGSDGFARMAYMGASGVLRLAVCNDAACSSPDLVTIADTSLDLAYVSLALDDDDIPYIAYKDKTDADLMFVACDDEDCSTSTVTAIDSDDAVDVGEYLSLALGSDGFARIAYSDESNDDLKAAQCTNADCSAKQISIVDTDGGGDSISLALASDDTIYVSYAGNSRLRLARGTFDTTAPTIDTLTPPDNATDVSTDNDIVITFNEDVELAGGGIDLFLASDDSELQSPFVGQVSGNEVRLVLNYPLTRGTEYYILIDPGAFEDEDGNAFAGISDPTTWNFTTQGAGSRGGSSGGSVRYGCKDEQATNYEYFSRHKQELCRYTTQTAITNISTPTLPVRDLELGLTGDDVLALQKLLNANGFILAETGVGSPGNETTFFGALTRAALSKYQVANGITPTAGYFGPITRAQMKAAGLAGLWW